MLSSIDEQERGKEKETERGPERQREREREKERERKRERESEKSKERARQNDKWYGIVLEKLYHGIGWISKRCTREIFDGTGAAMVEVINYK